MSHLRVAIIGGGIGGLALAAFISQHNPTIAVDVYERKPEISEAGAGIAIWKRSWQVLQDIGFNEVLDKRGIPRPKDGDGERLLFRKADQKEEGFDFYSHMIPYGPASVPRPILLDMLHSKIGPSCKVHISKRLASYSVDGDASLSLTFTDGTMASADVLVGADGVYSAVRATLYRTLAAAAKSEEEKATLLKCVEPRWSGWHAYRTIIPVDKIKHVNPSHQGLLSAKIWCGKHRHLTSYPIGPNIFLIAFHAVVQTESAPFSEPLAIEVTADELREVYAGWEPDVDTMLKLVEGKVSRWAVHVVEPLPQFVSGRVALLGDAAHGMTPHQGVGGGQSVEDAHLLGRLLSHPLVTSPAEVPAALQVFERARKAVTQAAAAKSHQNGRLYEFDDPAYPTIFDGTAQQQEYQELGEAISKSFQWLARGGCEEDWQAAQNELNAALSPRA